MTLPNDLDANPNTSAIIMVLVKKLGGRVEITRTDLIDILPPVSWNITETPQGAFILELVK